MRSTYLTLFVTTCLLFSFDALAGGGGLSSSGILDRVLERFYVSARSWGERIEAAAMWLFFTLALISLAWTFIVQSLKRGEIGDIFAELVLFTVTTGFFLWLLLNGTNFTVDIIASLQKLAGNATGLGDRLYPSQIVDIGFKVFSSVMEASSIWNPTDALVGFIISAVILVVLALIAVNMLLLLIASWILAYAGIWFLGFGGGRWTSDMAINYYKTVLGIAIQIFAMILIIGVGQDIIRDVERGMAEGMKLGDLAILLVVSICLLLLVEKIPAMLAGIITGQAVGGMGVGAFGAGAAVAGTAALAAATGSAAKAMENFTMQMGGLGSALNAALQQTHDNMHGGTGLFHGAGSGAGAQASAFASDFLQNLSSGFAGESKSMFDEKMGQAKDAISETFGGRVAEGIKQAGAPNYDMDGMMPTPSAEASADAPKAPSEPTAGPDSAPNDSNGFSSNEHASQLDTSSSGGAGAEQAGQGEQRVDDVDVSSLSEAAQSEINEFMSKGDKQ